MCESPLNRRIKAYLALLLAIASLAVGTSAASSNIDALIALTDGTVNVAYAYQFKLDPDPGKVTWSVNGDLPPELKLDPATGKLSGTPKTAGTYRFTIKVSDSKQELDKQVYYLTIVAPPKPRILRPGPNGGQPQAGGGDQPPKPDPVEPKPEPSKTASLKVVLLQQDGTPYKGAASIQAQQSDKSRSKEATLVDATKSPGVWTIDNVQTGNATILVVPDDKGFAKAAIPATIAADSNDLSVVLQPAKGKIKVKVFRNGTAAPIYFARVYLQKKSGSDYSTVASAFSPTSDGGSEYEIPIPDTTATYRVNVQADEFSSFTTPDLTSSTWDSEIRADLSPIDGNYVRSVMGIEQTGASSTKGTQGIFINFFFSRPLINKPVFRGAYDSPDHRPETNNPLLKLWADLRITNVPIPSNNTFTAATSATQFATTLQGQNLASQTLGASYLIGLQYRIASGRFAGVPLKISAAGGAGHITPFSAIDQNQGIFSVPSKTGDLSRYQQLINRITEVKSLNPSLTFKPDGTFDDSVFTASANAKTDVAFVLPDRSRFFGQYFAGLRFETFHATDINPVRPPFLFDVMLGQSEFVTGGSFHSAVLRLDLFYPIAVGNTVFYFFGNSQTSLSKGTTIAPLLLTPSTSVTVTSPGTLVVTVPQGNRDLYRIGVGISLSSLLNRGN